MEGVRVKVFSWMLFAACCCVGCEKEMDTPTSKVQEQASSNGDDDTVMLRIDTNSNEWIDLIGKDPLSTITFVADDWRFYSFRLEGSPSNDSELFYIPKVYVMESPRGLKAGTRVKIGKGPEGIRIESSN